MIKHATHQKHVQNVFVRLGRFETIGKDSYIQCDKVACVYAIMIYTEISEILKTQLFSIENQKHISKC